MATFKHISSKNTDYSAAEAYLIFEHDEFTMKPTLDENGRLIPRKGYRISTLNCGDEDFAIACMRANFRYGKNQQRGDVKSHHYIISFDPRDAPDHGLTVDWAQQLGEEFCSAHFPGHQAIVCTHPDGHNHSGNIHVHIVINSLRIAEVPFMPYMDRPCDTQPGMKHRCTNAAMEYFRGEVMEMCHAAGLNQIDLFNSKERVSEREYWAKKKGQLALEEENAVLVEQGLPVKQTKFETDKDKLRKQIRSVLSVAVSYENFAEKLLQLGITVKESRGRLSYLTPDRTKPITARKLGDDFDKAAVLAALDQNAQRAKVQTAPKRSTQVHSYQPEAVSRMVDIEAKRAEGKGQAYLHWAKIHNLKNASKAYLLYQEMGFSSPEELDAAYQETHARLDTVRTELKSIEGAIAEKKELQRHVLNYLQTKDTREGLVTDYILRHKQHFISVMQHQLQLESEENLKASRKQLERNERRIAELKRLFIKIYEDNAKGKLSDERFDMMSQSYETEQKQLEAEVIILRQEIEVQERQIENIEKFIPKAEKYVGIEEIDPYMLRELIKAIYVEAPDKSSGKRRQNIHIKYDGIGFIPLEELMKHE